MPHPAGPRRLSSHQRPAPRLPDGYPLSCSESGLSPIRLQAHADVASVMRPCKCPVLTQKKAGAGSPPPLPAAPSPPPLPPIALAIEEATAPLYDPMPSPGDLLNATELAAMEKMLFNAVAAARDTMLATAEEALVESVTAPAFNVSDSI